MIMIDPATKFQLGIPGKKLFAEKFQPDLTEIKNALSPMILSASGWRKIFAADGNEESFNPELTDADKLISLMMAASFASFIKKTSGKQNPRILLGTDSRPTGAVIADAMIRMFLSLDISVDYSFITAAPEIMARAGTDKGIDGFAYISASHNPIGHNGVKFGLKTGGVIDGKQAAILIKLFQDMISSESQLKKAVEAAAAVSSNKIEKIFLDVPVNKKASYLAYINFARRVVSGVSEEKKIEKFIRQIQNKAEKRGIGIIGELNGSARCLTIDRELLESSGLIWKGVNDQPRKITHRIVPEGFSLELCRDELEKARNKDKRFLIGFVPDNDGDRGNIVYYNSGTGKAEILEAQEVFALSVLGELTYLDYLSSIYPGDTEFCKPRGVVVNGPTSLRIDKIAETLNTEVFRAEVGEANVVNRAKLARKAGYIVPILGEGSNGGNITFPSAVRDPLNTIFALLKLLLFTGEPENNIPGLFESWCIKSGQEELYNSDFDLTDILASLPQFTTTSAFENRALMRIKGVDHSVLKNRYEKFFLAEWEKRKDELRDRFGITGYREINYEGTKARKGFGNSFRTGAQKGGLKIEFLTQEEKPTAYIWMRGSGTEPVFRILADVGGSNSENEAWLLGWHRSMIEKADLDS